ncbi:MAG: hypothetical protein COZ70_08890 [Deltaproteobacteria bacterium CG_4_8_14_3_um_filter_51_11]|nr:cell division protein FtsL [bacterium]OIP43713.1 MAG: hypothetical protein AUK25_00770 [Desulfobacteraceae bacterium CG2_30_51_40]PIP48155.1 MAG: hypothetical protein COX16_01920 [Deltaproteobacteria bacterium CG23_combo_of_CG06-09_8_20_14_all_51_20]PIX19431.1 MAG: hypothetical protein COZ70_08890 [Deltaproteobacteria bacterium CG_4_8_14_3_um_filter_51_11]PIY23324.1 MAG: hypothetical protein COZ11_09845 [Deltaproteobacteria bacterium CG_4_10_14_3_um_filter_51_14]PJB35056.1 MAG: hypothetical
MIKKARRGTSAGVSNRVKGVLVKNTRAKGRGMLLSRRQVLLVFTLLTFFTLSGIGYVWSNFERTQVSYKLSELKKHELILKENNKKLRIELATLKSTHHLENTAMTKLGLNQPSPSQIVVLP